MKNITVRQIRESEKDYWDENIQNFEQAHPLNAYGWGKVREVDGWKPIYLVAEKSGRFCGALLLLVKRLPFLPWRIFYGPKGPLCRLDDSETIRAIHTKVLELAKKNNAIFLRIDPNIREEECGSFEEIVLSLKYVHLAQRWTFWNSPRDVYRIDLTEVNSAEELFKISDHSIHSSTRKTQRQIERSIRKAQREGVVIEVATTKEELREFYHVFQEHTIEKRFMARAYAYQEKLWDAFLNQNRGRLFVAKYQGKIIGGLILIAFAHKCLAMHRGVLYKYRSLRVNDALVWEGIKWSKENGCSWYSFRGVGTTPTQEAFKRKFNPKVVSLVGYYDFPSKPLLYKLFHWTEFTLLPASWPLIIRTRELANRMMKGFSH